MGRFIVIPVEEGALVITDELLFARGLGFDESLGITDALVPLLAPLLPPPHFRPHYPGWIVLPYGGMIQLELPPGTAGFIAPPQGGQAVRLDPHSTPGFVPRSTPGAVED
jgi:hypothetical protein